MEAERILSRAKAIELGEKFYFTGKPCPSGHIAKRYVSSFGCTSCTELFVGNEEKKQYLRDYYAAKPKVIRPQTTPSQLAHRAMVRKWKKRIADSAYRAANAEKVKAYRDEYQKNNKERIKARQKLNEISGIASIRRSSYHAKKLYDANYVSMRTARNLLNKTLARVNIKKTAKTFLILGYGHAELKERLESLFLEGMGWHNRSEWHIDHIIPVAEFVRLGITDPAKICALPNLRPIWAKDNMAKKDFFELTPYDPHLRKVVKAA